MEPIKVTLAGKEYTLKNVSLLGIKMLGTKFLRDADIEKMLTWIEDDAKIKIAEENFSKFLKAVLVEEYVGPSLMDIPESEVIEVTETFFDLATVKKIKK